MSYSVKSSISDQETANNGSSSAASCCSRASSELKLYQAFIFSVPIFFTFILLFLFYLFYLRRRRVDWSSLRMRTATSIPTSESGNDDDVSRCELGVKKELREMLPIIVFKESFSVRDAQCSVCLGDYQAEDRLQQIPACRHTFHMDCIDLWLAAHTTCPICRQSLLPSTKAPPCAEDGQVEASIIRSSGGEEEGALQSHDQHGYGTDEVPQTSQQAAAVSNSQERE
ncbi:RING-H2 finger protein ATL7-like isoform X2 [Andrographis paniculata]|uniref:RING-H2 finger protein ATL7-like isoform X2 n=1 Tax=Andrographis paniculata TaxID=175694 RepID=UPI0021E8B663|nr:RING-H2 finger protein ATL7-like isoform X2 [Andrographis paniculata]